MLLDILCGRHDCWIDEKLWPAENGIIQMNRFCIEGKVMWEVEMWRNFWAGVRSGELGLNPKELFRREWVN